MEEWNNSTEVVAMSLIASAGTGKSLAFDALSKARCGKIEDAQQLMNEAQKAITEAHKAQMNLLQEEAQGNGKAPTLLLVHAQDHLMTGMLAVELIAEIISLHAQNRKEAL